MLWLMLGCIVLAGAIGGVINALLAGDGVIMWHKVSGTDVYQPGIVGNVILGASATAVSWALSGAFGTVTLLQVPSSGASTQTVSLTFSALAVAVLIGAAGAKWWSSEVDKQIDKSTKAELATRAGFTAEQTGEFFQGTPEAAWRVAKAGPGKPA
jgi:hypothetical protein